MNTKINTPLDFITGGEISKTVMNGIDDDLLSGGIGFEGFRQKNPPPFSDPEKPTDHEIRKRTLWGNYRALMDIHEAYYGKFYGPGCGYHAPEKIAGTEYKALMDGGIAVMLQIPAHFNMNKPYLISVASSGSRGIYGGIGVVGEWALKRGFAVVYTDKGTGVGYHILDTDRVCLLNGQWEDAKKAGQYSSFTAISKDSEIRRRIISEHKKRYPHRIAVKHAHSGQNPQKDWGLSVLRSITFAKTLLEDIYPGIGSKIKVLAAGISNGGLSAVMAKEMDKDGLIDAVAVSEPNVTPEYEQSLAIVQGDAPPFYGHSKNLADYITLFNIFQPAASLSSKTPNAPYRFDSFGVSKTMCEERCRSLREQGLLKGETIEEQANHALSIIHESGTVPDQDILLPSHYCLDVARSISVTYVSQYGRFDVTEHALGYSFAAVDKDGRPRALTPAEEAQLYSDQSGIPPLGTIRLINDLNPDGPLEDRRSASPSTGRYDMNLDGALALRRIVTGIDEKNGLPLTGKEWDMHLRVVKGMNDVKVKGDLKGCPAIFVTGRSDSVLPVNHTSRPYVGVNRIREKEKSGLRYYEVKGAHHVDALNMLYRDKKNCLVPMSFVPLHVYYLKTLDLMIAHLDHGAPLPESQVIRPGNPEKNLPDIAAVPLPEDRIRFEDNTLFIPE